MRPGSRFAAVVVTGVMPSAIFAADAGTSSINSADTAWMMVATALVLFMTIPGLALFYGGLVRSKNVLSILMQCFAITCLVSVLWVVYGYSFAFDRAGMEKGVTNWSSFIGGGSNLFLRALTQDSVAAVAPTIPESVFCMFQMAFAIITPALLIGAFAERLRFSAVMWFTALWVTLVYIPICHMAWSGDGSFFGDRLGTLDFAGGTVIEINSGISSLIAALMVGRRIGYPQNAILPHNSVMCVTGAAMLWIGWFGFNAGSALAANGNAGMALLTTHLAAAAGGLTWSFIEWLRVRKASALGIVTGAVAGLVAITPACGYVGPLGGLAIGVAASVACFTAVAIVKKRFGYDDTLDVFGIHGIGGIVGMLLTGVFAARSFGGMRDIEIGAQLWSQAQAAVITIVYAAVVTAIILKVLDLTVGLRVAKHEENTGLDLTHHGEVAYNP